MSFSRYPSYKRVNRSDLDSVPSRWEIRRLKHVASFRNSNVDKLSNEYEEAVELCNYTDVYYNETIHGGIKFMRATATAREIEQFSLRQGDVLLTKDSEDRDDIGIPAIACDSMHGVVCGYHLTLIRPIQKLHAEFLFRFLQSNFAKYQFKVRASGVTRYSLGQDAIGSLMVPVPSDREQRKIVSFLVHETTRIDRLTERQQRLIELLDEKRQAVISHAVTKGLDPNAPMKDSGLDGMGHIPAHWKISRLKYVSKPGTTITYGIVQAGPHVPDGVPYIRTSDMSGSSLPEVGYLRTSKEIDLSYKRSKVRANDIVIAIRATVGKALPVPDPLDGANLTQGTAKFSPSEHIDRDFILQYLRATPCAVYFLQRSKGATFSEITLETLRNTPFPVPPIDEQHKIAKWVSKKLDRLNVLRERVDESIRLLGERRSSLISAAVTGKIDVRNWKPPESVSEAGERDQELLEAAEEQAGYG